VSLRNSATVGGLMALVWAAVPYAAALLGTGALAILVMGLARGARPEVLLLAAALAAAAALALVWNVRARARGRFNAALDAYAEQQLARQRRRRLLRKGAGAGRLVSRRTEKGTNSRRDVHARSQPQDR
jgi:hypothetical protein